MYVCMYVCMYTMILPLHFSVPIYSPWQKKKKKKKNSKNKKRRWALARAQISQQSILKQGFQKTHFPTVLKVENFFAVDLANF